MRWLPIVLFFITLSFAATAQKTKIEGKVTDSKTGLALPGVSVLIKNSNKGVATDQEGRYVINADAGTKITLIFSYNGITKEVEDIEVKNNEISTQDVALDVKAKTGEGVVVRSTTNARKETAASLIAFQKNTNTVASVISSEAIRRSPDKNTGEVLKRIPGTSIQEGRFIVVRGLADRYNQAMLNGVLLTSTEPDRKTFSFDLIPSSMIDNIVVNKAFVPEYPGEWAGGLIQVNTKDIPSKGFFNIQIGTGFNSQTLGRDFYRDKSGNNSLLGIDNGSRDLPDAYTTKSEFDNLTITEKTAIGKQMKNAWTATKGSPMPNVSLQLNGGFNTKLFKKIIGGNFGISYSKTNQYIKLQNNLNKISNVFTVESMFNDDRYRDNISSGAFGSFTVQFNPRNKVSVKSIVNINTNNTVTERNGIDISRDDKFLKGTELAYKQNTFFTVQVNGEHSISTPLKFKWYGAYNILDGYIPDQRRILYSRKEETDPYRAVISNSLSQQSGSRIYQSLNDYIYTAGGDLGYNFELFGQKQNLKAGYMLQIKDRLYDAKLFANHLEGNEPLKLLPADQIFAPQNFGNGRDNLIRFDAIKGRTFRYMANTILNAGFLQFDNQIATALRIVWGLRVENYDQLVGSVKKYDPRHTYTKVTDFLPGINATYKLNTKTNIRLSGSQTVIRPELRELSFLNLYDFELNASVQGKPTLERTKVTNIDLRYELYPRAGETFSVGLFYKYFSKPIEQLFNEGSGGASTFTFQNPKKAFTYGVEVEMRKKMDFIGGLKNLTIQANGAYMYSRIKDKAFQVDRPLQGQSPFLVNIGLLYDIEKLGLNATVLYNQIGNRIYLVGDISSGSASPDIYEATRPLLDFQLAKKVLKTKGEIRLNISDLLNRTQYFYQNVNDKKSLQKSVDAYRFTRKPGTNFNITFNYSL
jgi:TonB-dependent receptor